MATQQLPAKPDEYIAQFTAVGPVGWNVRGLSKKNTSSLMEQLRHKEVQYATLTLQDGGFLWINKKKQMMVSIMSEADYNKNAQAKQNPTAMTNTGKTVPTPSLDKQEEEADIPKVVANHTTVRPPDDKEGSSKFREELEQHGFVVAPKEEKECPHSTDGRKCLPKNCVLCTSNH